MPCPLRLRGDFKIASEMLLVARAAGVAPEIAPAVGGSPALHENGGSNPLDAPQRTLLAGWAARAMATGEPADEKVECHDTEEHCFDRRPMGWDEV